MASLDKKIKLYCEANGKTVEFGFQGNVTLTDLSDGKGAFIQSWNVEGLAKPSDSQLASYETAANKEEKNNVIRNTRRLAYGNIGDQLDEIYHDIDAWKARLQTIKTDNPKE